MSTLLFVFIITFFITNNDASKILAVFPVPSISHQFVFRPLTEELAKNGHEVTVITTDPAFPKDEAPPNLKEIDLHDFSYEYWRNLYKITSKGNRDTTEAVKTAFHMINSLFEMQMQVDEVQKLLKEEKFDLLLLAACVKPALALSHHFKIPVIQISTFGSFNFNVATIGSSWHPLLYPQAYTQRVYNLTKWEKVVSMWNFYKFERMMDQVEIAENEAIKRVFGPDVPNINELQNNVDMLFLNIHPLWEGNRPVPPSVVYVGGLHLKPPKELPKDLKTFLDSSKNGVVYMSFGTNVQPSLLPPEKIQTIVKVFSKLPYDVLWKWDKDELPGRTDNIRIAKWLPQPDLLRHPKIKAFITQGGLQSTYEAIAAGVPLIGLPMLGDQWYNAEKYVHHKIGVKVEMETLTEGDFRKAIDTVIDDASYRRNIVSLCDLMRDGPMTSLDVAVWWTEYVLRHGGAKHLRAPAANMPWTEYLELELVLTVASVLLVLISLFLVLVYKLWSILSKNKSQREKFKTK